MNFMNNSIFKAHYLFTALLMVENHGYYNVTMAMLLDSGAFGYINVEAFKWWPLFC